MSRGKVEMISSLVQWRVDGVERMGPWTDGDSKERSYCWSDPFNISTSEWCLGVARHKTNQDSLIGLKLINSSFLSKEQPLVATFVFRFFCTGDKHRSCSSCSSAVSEIEIKPNVSIWPMKYPTNTWASLAVQFEFLDLKIPPLNGGKESRSIWFNDGTMMHSLATKNSHPCLSRMLEEKIYADVTINTPDGVLRAHKAVLSASSPVFQSMFLHDLKEKETSTIDIEDMSSDSCRALLCYMYGTITQEEYQKHLHSLLALADKYGMTELKDRCEKSLLEDICSSNVLESLREAWLYQLDKVKQRCWTYLFDFGKIHDVKDEIDSFYLNADEELKLEMFRQVVKHVANGFPGDGLVKDYNGKKKILKMIITILMAVFGGLMLGCGAGTSSSWAFPHWYSSSCSVN